MGGWGSGRTSRRSLVEHALTIDLPHLMRRGWICDGESGRFRLRFSHCGEQISLSYDLSDPYEAWLHLNYKFASLSGERAKVVKAIRLTFTEPNFGGRRWWMICPSGGQRVSKLYLPAGGDMFASREEWRLAYRSQRSDKRDRTFGKLFRLQRKLGCEEQWGAEPSRPKGMWRSTFERQFGDYLQLDALCAASTDVWIADLKARLP